jgi:trehalose/maltose hydrolase-like predicted phosphorylase
MINYLVVINKLGLNFGKAIQGDLDAATCYRVALYNLYSFIRPETRQSIAPMGLSSQGYNGHIFLEF